MLNNLQSILKSWYSSPEKFFLAVTVPFAVVVVFLLPPFQAPDEHTHFFKAVQISEGKLYGRHMIGRIGGQPVPLVGDYLPSRYRETADHYIHLRVNTIEKANVAQIKKDIMNPILDDSPLATPFENTVVYQPLTYIPQAIAVFATNLITKNVLVQLYLARLASLAVSSFLLYMAIRLLPFGKWAVVALSSTPLMLLLLASCAGDAITFSLSAVFIAQVLVLLRDSKTINRRTIAKLIVVSVALGLCKTPYFLISLFVFAIPMRKFKYKKEYILTVLCCIIGAFIVTAIWSASVNKILINVALGANTSGQISYVINNVLSLPKAIAKTYIGAAGNYVPQDIVDLSAGVAASLPFWFIIITYVLITITILGESTTASKLVDRKLVRYVAIIVGIIGFIAINILLYITFTPVGANRIDGLQGRYFMPFTLLAIPAATGLLAINKRQYQKFTILLRVFVVICGLATIYILARRYY